jgi:hypothetical protein
MAESISEIKEVSNLQQAYQVLMRTPQLEVGDGQIYMGMTEPERLIQGANALLRGVPVPYVKILFSNGTPILINTFETNRVRLQREAEVSGDNLKYQQFLAASQTSCKMVQIALLIGDPSILPLFREDDGQPTWQEKPL